MRTKLQEDSFNAAKALDLSHAESWNGTHRGIKFRIHRHNAGGYGEPNRNAWAYYIYVCPLNFSPEDWQRVAPKFHMSAFGGNRAFYEAPAFDCGDFHSGITWCDVKCSPATPDQITVEIGCDYSHLWDGEAGYPYDVEYLLRDVKNTIDKLHENYTLLIWSWRNGTYHREADLEAYHKSLLAAEAEKVLGEVAQ